MNPDNSNEKMGTNLQNPKRREFTMNYNMEVWIDGNEEMVEINIREKGGDWVCYGGTSLNDLPENLAGSIQEFVEEYFPIPLDPGILDEEDKTELGLG